MARLHNSPAFIHAASDREGSERSRSMARDPRIIHAAGLHRESIASGCYPALTSDFVNASNSWSNDSRKPLKSPLPYTPSRMSA